MQHKQIISGAVTGTSVMTLASYCISALKQNNFKEPQILGILIERLAASHPRFNSRLAGWALHYAVGVLFVTVYDKLWSDTRLQPNVTNGLALGALSSLPAVAVWHLTLKLHPRPPRLDREKFYAHLVTAHIIFGLFAALGYGGFKEKQD
jgi:hypothetical protein